MAWVKEREGEGRRGKEREGSIRSEDRKVFGIRGRIQGIFSKALKVFLKGVLSFMT